MGCCQYFTPSDGGSDTFSVEMPRLTFGRGCLLELGERIKAHGVRRAAVLTDTFLAGWHAAVSAASAIAMAGAASFGARARRSWP